MCIGKPLFELNDGIRVGRRFVETTPGIVFAHGGEGKSGGGRLVHDKEACNVSVPLEEMSQIIPVGITGRFGEPDAGGGD